MHTNIDAVKVSACLTIHELKRIDKDSSDLPEQLVFWSD